MNPQEHVQRYSTLHDVKLKRLCKPLELHFGIDMFFYFAIDRSGYFHTICNQGGLSEEFFANSLYKGHPMFRHPDLIIQEPFVLNYQVDIYEDEAFKRSFKEKIERYPLKKNFFMVEPTRAGFQAYGFTSQHPRAHFENRVFNNLPLLKAFVRFFQEEAQGLIKQSRANCVDIASLCGPSFQTPAKELQGVLAHEKKADFLSRIGRKLPDFTRREKECLYWFMRRRSARQIAEKLFLSTRTVENHLWSAKNKLGGLPLEESFDLLESISLQ